MTNLHLVAGKKTSRKALEYIQIKNGFVYATNASIFVKFPLVEVFGENTPFTEKDEFYISADSWKKVGFSKAAQFNIVNNDVLQAYDKNREVLGMVQFLTAGEMLNLVGNYPDIDTVIPTSPLVEIDTIAFNPDLLKDLTDCIKASRYNFEFRGQNKIIMVKALDSKVVAGIMPLIVDKK